MAAESYWLQLKKWNRDSKSGVGKGLRRRRVFVASMSDVFEDWRGVMHDVSGNVAYAPPKPWMSHYEPMRMEYARNRLLDAIVEHEWLDFLVLTKRPENIHPMLSQWLIDHAGGALDRLLPLDNLWLGTSAGSQETLDTAAPALLEHAQRWGRFAFLSCEPQIEAKSPNWRRA